MARFKCQCGNEVQVLIEDGEGYGAQDAYAKVKCCRCGRMMEEVE